MATWWWSAENKGRGVRSKGTKGTEGTKGTKGSKGSKGSEQREQPEQPAQTSKLNTNSANSAQDPLKYKHTPNNIQTHPIHQHKNNVPRTFGHHNAVLRRQFIRREFTQLPTSHFHGVGQNIVQTTFLRVRNVQRFQLFGPSRGQITPKFRRKRPQIRNVAGRNHLQKSKRTRVSAIPTQTTCVKPVVELARYTGSSTPQRRPQKTTEDHEDQHQHPHVPHCHSID